MPKLLNYSEREYTFWPPEASGPKDLIAGGAPSMAIALATKAITIPRARAPQGEDQDRRDVKLIPGELEVTKEVLAAMKAHPAAQHWFYRDALVVDGEAPAPIAKSTKAA